MLKLKRGNGSEPERLRDSPLYVDNNINAFHTDFGVNAGPFLDFNISLPDQWVKH